jgi:hypothetical protein
MTKQSVAIFQTYVPSYREPFFTRLIDSLDGLGIGCDIFAGSPPHAMGQRGDSVRPPWLTWHQPRYLDVRFKKNSVLRSFARRAGIHGRDCGPRRHFAGRIRTPSSSSKRSAPWTLGPRRLIR